MKNNLGALNEYLFAQLDVLSNDELKGDNLEEEIKRSKAITDIAKTVVANANTVLRAKQYATEYIKEVPEMLEG